MEKGAAVILSACSSSSVVCPADCLTALETVGRLSQVDMNEDAICAHVDDVIYEQIIALLMLHDIQIVVAALEALYQLSELGDVTTTRIAQVSAAVSK